MSSRNHIIAKFYHSQVNVKDQSVGHQGNCNVDDVGRGRSKKYQAHYDSQYCRRPGLRYNHRQDREQDRYEEEEVGRKSYRPKSYAGGESPDDVDSRERGYQCKVTVRIQFSTSVLEGS